MAESTPNTPESASSESSAAATAASPAAAEPKPAGTPLPECYSVAFGMNPQKDRAREQLRHSLFLHFHSHFFTNAHKHTF